MQVAALAAAEHGVFPLEQLTALGFSARVVQQRAASGRWHRIFRGVYSLVPPPLLTWRARYRAAVLACGPGAVLSHRSAADLHGLLATSRAKVDVTVPGRGSRNRPGIDVHRSTTLTPDDITTVDGIPCTAVARTLLDLAAVATDERVERALNQADVLQRLDYRALHDQLHGNAHAVAAAKLRAALAVYQPGLAPTESRLEQDFVVLVRGAGLPEPERQVWFTLNDGDPPIRVDFAWRTQRVVVETNGRRSHGTRGAFERDRRRDQRLTRAGWRVVRITWRQLRDDPAGVMELMGDLLG